MLFLFSSNPFNPFPETQFFHHIFVQRDRELGKRERKNYFKPENIKKIQNYKHWSSYHQELISLLTYRYMLTIFIFEIYICVSICYTCILYKTIWIFTFYKIIDRYVFVFSKLESHITFMQILKKLEDSRPFRFLKSQFFLTLCHLYGCIVSVDGPSEISESSKKVLLCGLFLSIK